MNDATTPKKRRGRPRAHQDLRDLLTENNELKSRIEALTEDLEKEKVQHGYTNTNKQEYHRRSNAFGEELDQLHGLLDALPGALPRETPVGEYSKRQNLAMTRLASWLAIR